MNIKELLKWVVVLIAAPFVISLVVVIGMICWQGVSSFYYRTFPTTEVAQQQVVATAAANGSMPAKNVADATTVLADATLDQQAASLQAQAGQMTLEYLDKLVSQKDYLLREVVQETKGINDLDPTVEKIFMIGTLVRYYPLMTTKLNTESEMRVAIATGVEKKDVFFVPVSCLAEDDFKAKQEEWVKTNPIHPNALVTWQFRLKKGQETAPLNFRIPEEGQYKVNWNDGDLLWKVNGATWQPVPMNNCPHFVGPTTVQFKLTGPIETANITFSLLKGGTA